MQAKTVSVGPITAAVPNQVCASQTPNAGQIVINGAGATFSINNVAGAQDPAGAGNLTLAAGAGSFGGPRYVYVTSASNDTSITFTIYGYGANGGTLIETITGANTKASVTRNQFIGVTQVAVSGNSGSVQVGSFASASFTGGSTRQVTITTAADERTNTFVVTGTDSNGAVISETVAGPNATVATTVAYFRTVTSVTAANNAAGALTVGMTNTGSSPWVRFDDFAPSNISIQCDVSGTVTYTVQSSLDDPNDPFSPVAPSAMNWVNTSDANVVAATTTQQSNFLFAPKWARVLVTTTSTGSVNGMFLQSSNGPK
jgi:hypothetical protein